MKLTNYIGKYKLKAHFGIDYLDKNFTGITEDDFWLIGARSGAGKSTIADIIATYNAQKGIKVTLISLENFEGDNFVAKAYYKYKQLTQNYSLKLRDFICENFDVDIDALKKAEIYANSQYKNIHMINRQVDYKIENLYEDIVGAACKQKSNLVIIDHIDYLDKDYAGESDIAHITQLVKTIRDTQNTFKVPVVAISHLRKAPNQRDNVIVPSVDEFIGSSNKYKQATGTILLAPDEETNLQSMSHLKATWCCVRKLRQGGIDNKVARIFFNTKTGLYEPKYEEYKVNFGGTKVEPIIQQSKLCDYWNR